MKYLIFSDSHLTHVFDPKLFLILEDAILLADKVIIAGDFWESYLTDIDRLLESPWQKLFKLLKERDAFYIFGNSDTEEFNEDKWRAFATDAGDEYRFEANGYQFIVQHGHLVFNSFREKLPSQTDRSRSIGQLKNILEFIDGRLLFGRLLGISKAISKRNLKSRVHPKSGEIYVFGHSHYAEDDREHGFIMLGNNRHGIGSYLLIDDESKEIKLFKDLRY